MADDLATIWTTLALDGVGDLVGDARPGFVVDGAGRRLLFANAAARRFLGLAPDRLAPPLALDDRLRDRLARFAARAETGEESRELLRFFTGLRPTLLSVAFRRPSTAVDAVVVRIETAPPVAGDERPEASLAALVADGGLVALFDGNGDVTAAEGDHAVLEQAQDDVADLLDDPEDPPVLERSVVAGAHRHDLALVRLGDRPDARRLLWIGPARPLATAEPAPTEAAPLTDTATDPVAAVVTEATPSPLAPPAPTTLIDGSDLDDDFADDLARWSFDAAQAPFEAAADDAEAASPAAPAPIEPIAVPPSDVAPIDPVVAEPTPATLADEDLFVAAPPLAVLADDDTLDDTLDAAWAAPHEIATPAPVTDVAAEPVATVAAEPVTEPQPIAAPEAAPTPLAAVAEAPSEADAPEVTDVAEAATAAFRFAPLDRAVKFVWQMDADHRFTMVSDELAATVGPRAADLVGATWDAVAGRLALDDDGAVAAALSRRDTWSGLTVLWPVEGAALRLPVDLAALPVFGRGRSFAGFRGFGTCRAEAALPDPTALGLRLAAPADASATAAPAALLAPTAPAAEPAADVAPVAAPAVDVDTVPVAEPVAEPAIATTIAPLVADEPPLWDDDDEIALLATAEAHLPHDDAFDDAFVGEIDPLPSVAAPAADTTATLDPDTIAPDTIDDAATPLLAPPPPLAALTAPIAPAALAAPAVHAALAAPIAPEALAAPVAPAALAAPIEHAALAAPATDAPSPDTDTDIDTVDEAPTLTAATPAPATTTVPAHALAEPAPLAEPARSAEPARPGPRLVALAGASRAKAEAARLSAPERQAFRQIAEALGARIEGEDHEPVTDQRTPEPRPAPLRPTEPRPEPHAAAEPATGRADAAAVPASLPTVDTRLLDRLPVGVALIKDDVVIHANERFLALVGHPDVATFEAEGGIDALFAGEHVARRFETAEAGRPTPIIARDGSVVPCDAVLTPVPWNGGSALMLTLTQAAVAASPARTATAPAAVTPAAAPAAALAAPPAAGDFGERIRELEAIIDTATDGVLMLDADGVVLSANTAAEALFGCERAAMIGRPLTERLAPESRRSAVDYLDGLTRNGVASVLNDGREVIAVVAPEGLIPLFMTIGRLSSGSSAKYCAVLRDITHWKKSEEELTAARRRAEEASVHKSDFLAKISHEIRTPLNAIIGFSELMMDERFGPIGNERYKDYLRDIHVSGTHIMSLVNDLLDLSKVEAGKMDLRFEAVALADVVSETVAMMQPQANRERIIIRSSLPAGVPPVVADGRSMRQVVLNLLSNAIKFTPAGGQVIVSTTLEDNGEVVLRVRDTGYGMTDKEMQTAMEPFRQLHTTRSRAGGTGLGLPLTKALVEANRAMFRIDSTVGQGTLVSIAFPVTRVLAS